MARKLSFIRFQLSDFGQCRPNRAGLRVKFGFVQKQQQLIKKLNGIN